MSMDILAFGLPGGVEWIVILLFSAIIPLAFWKICAKTGFPGVLGLLMLVPVANIILLLYLAFTDWPIQKELNQLKQQ